MEVVHTVLPKPTAAESRIPWPNPYFTVCEGANPRVDLSYAWVIISLRHVVVEWVGSPLCGGLWLQIGT